MGARAGKAAARRAGQTTMNTGIEREARQILTEGTALSRAAIAARARTIRARQKRHGSRAAQLVREDRER